MGVTRSEFAERFRRAQKAGKRFDFAWTVVFFGVLIGSWLWVRFFGHQIPDSIWSVYLIVFFGFVLVSTAFARYMARRIQRNAGVCCTICQEILDKRQAALALTTGNCSHCSQRFLTE